MARPADTLESGCDLRASSVAIAEALRSAREAGLRYVSDVRGGIRRLRKGKGFVYRNGHGRLVRDPQTIARIRSLAVPPAWRDVWICPFGDGHLQATGYDARGRKQYRYHPQWRATRDQTKYDRLAVFARALPAIRARVERDLARPGLAREKVLATVIRLMERTLIRVGNDEYARHNGSYGLTTMRDEHVQVRGPRLRFRFRGKSGIEHEIHFEDPRLARIVARCQDLPGQELFAYVDPTGRWRDVTSSDVNQYLREIAGQEFTAKDFRTWWGTTLAAEALRRYPPPRSKAEGRRNVNEAISGVAERLGNTKAICRKCYVHPAVVEAYLAGTLSARMHSGRGRPNRHPPREPSPRLPAGPGPQERAVLGLLERTAAGRRWMGSRGD